MVAPAREPLHMLLQVGTILLVKPPNSVHHLLPLLDQLESILSRMDQSPSRKEQRALSPSLKALVSDDIFRHQDEDVRVSVAACISEIIRITAPEAPYDDQQMKDIFQLIVSSLENISDNALQSYPKRTAILHIIDGVKACLIMLDLECHGLIVEMFRLFLRAIRDHHPESVFSCMESIMTVILEESDDPSELIHPILASVKRGNEAALPISRKLGERLLQNCATKLKPLLVHAFKHMGYCIDDYSRLVASICYGTANDAASHDNNEYHVEQVEAQLVENSPNETVLATGVLTESCSGGLHDSDSSGIGNGMPDIQEENRSLDMESSKADCTHHTDSSVVMNVGCNSEPVCSETGTVVMQVSTSEQACQGREPESSSSVSSKEPPLSSQAENEKGEEILDGQENHIREVSNQPFDEPDDNMAQPSRNDKIDIHAIQGREPEPSSFVSSKEPPLSSQAENGKGEEILDRQENHIHEVSDQPFDEPDANVAQPSVNDKIDIEACQGREPEPSSLVSSKEPPLSSQAENDKGEDILGGQENHICEVSDQPFDEADDNMVQPSRIEKIDIHACQGREPEPSSLVSSKEPLLSSHVENDKGEEILDGQENHVPEVSDQPFDEPDANVAQPLVNEKIDIEACQGREPERSSLVSSKEPPLSSQAENDKGEDILEGQENHIREVSDQPFDEPDDNAVQPSKSEKNDIQSCKERESEPSSLVSSKEPLLSSHVESNKGEEILDDQENHIREVSDPPFEPDDNMAQLSRNEKNDIQAYQGSEPEPSSLVYSEEPTLSSQAENDKVEGILDGQENHIREVCNKPFDETDDNLAQPSKNEKIDVQLPSSKAFDFEPMNVASSSPSRDIIGSLPINAGEIEKIENLIEEPTPVISKKASDGTSELDKTLLQPRDETLLQLRYETINGHNLEKTLLPTLRSKIGTVLSSDSDGAPPHNCCTKVFTGDSLKDKSSVKQKKCKKRRGRRQECSKKNVAKNPAKEDDREMLDSRKSPAASGEDACQFDQIPKINSKKECVPPEDTEIVPSSRSPSLLDGDACQLDQTPKTTSKRKRTHGEDSETMPQPNSPSNLGGDSCQLGRTPETPSKRKSARGKDIAMVPSPDSPSELNADACLLDQIPKTTSKRKRTPRRNSASNVIKSADDLIGAKIKVWWPKDAMFYEGVVDSFDPTEKTYKVLYTDGDEEVLNLEKERWELINLADKEQVTACENPDSSGSTHLNKKSRTNSKSSANRRKIGSSRMARGRGDSSSKCEGPGSKTKLARQKRGKGKALNNSGKHEDDWNEYCAGSLRRSSRSVVIASKRDSQSNTVDAAKTEVSTSDGPSIATRVTRNLIFQETPKRVCGDDTSGSRNKSKRKASEKGDKVNSNTGEKKVNLAEAVKTAPTTGKADKSKGIGKKRVKKRRLMA